MLHDLTRPRATAQMSPATYLRLRREAAGLTIGAAAARFWSQSRAECREDCERNLRTFETEGIVMKPWLAADINRAFPFDAGVYLTLAEEPADRHPTLCSGCGWDEFTVEQDLVGNAVRWVAPHWCSRCDQRAGDQTYRQAQLL